LMAVVATSESFFVRSFSSFAAFNNAAASIIQFFFDCRIVHRDFIMFYFWTADIIPASRIEPIRILLFL
jgi:hypothetical protein